MRFPRIIAGAIAGVLALGCVYVGLGTTAAPGLLPSSWHAPEHASDRESDLVSAGRTATNALFATNYQTVDADLKRVVSLSTGTFKSQYQSASVQLAALFRQLRLVRTVKIRQIATGGESDSSALVLVAADAKAQGQLTQKATGKKGTQGGTTTRPFENSQSLRLELTMNKVGGRWLVENLVITP
ncbi:MAG: hypothetical protein ACJ72E_04755 [Marmoricola sp.]